MKDEIEAISHLTAQDAIHSLNQLVKAKAKAIGDYLLPERDRADVQQFFQEQKNKFRSELNADLLGTHLVGDRQTVHDRHKLEAAHRANERCDRRREEIVERKQLEEVRRRKKALRTESVETAKINQMHACDSGPNTPGGSNIVRKRWPEWPP